MRHTLTRQSRRVSGTFALAGALLAVACGGADTATEELAVEDAAPVCPTPADSIIGGAIEKFIGTRDAVPHRFLVPLGTEEAVPDGAQYVLYAQGRQMYLWPPDTAMQAQQISNMRARGAHITMVLLFHGVSDMADGKKSIDLSGRYIDVANRTKTVPRTSIIFDCFAPAGSRFVASDKAPAGGE